MAIDTKSPGDPGWWMARLLRRLGEVKGRYDRLERYYTGDCHIPVLTNKTVRDAYYRLMEVSRTNFAELVVEATRERMEPLGFRTGAAADELGDKEAWRIWQANSLDADSDLVHTSMLSMGDAYVIVGDVDEELGAALITPEDPREVITEQDPARRRKTIAGLKAFRDTVAGVDRAYLYLPGVVYKAVKPITNGSKGMTYSSGRGWEWDGEEQELPAEVVPVVRFANRANLGHRSWGEYETHLHILNRINYVMLQQLEIATLQAFRQRAIKGVKSRDEQGNEIDYDDLFSADPGAMWRLPATAELWESGQVNLDPIRNVIKDDVERLAAVTRTPLFYLTPDATNGSAEGASLAREGLVFKTTNRIKNTSESWEQVMALAFLFGSDAVRAKRSDMEVLWRSPERYSLAERADAAVKAKASGMTWRAIMSSIWQWSPQEIAAMEREMEADQILAGAVPADATVPVPADAPVA